LKDGEELKSFFVKISIFYIFFPVNNLVDINDDKYIILLLVKRLTFFLDKVRYIYLYIKASKYMRGKYIFTAGNYEAYLKCIFIYISFIFFYILSYQNVYKNININ